MTNYREMKKQRDQNSKRLSQATNKANNLDNVTEFDNMLKSIDEEYITN